MIFFIYNISQVNFINKTIPIMKQDQLSSKRKNEFNLPFVYDWIKHVIFQIETDFRDQA
jgi:hypothetical protein